VQRSTSLAPGAVGRALGSLKGNPELATALAVSAAIILVVLFGTLGAHDLQQADMGHRFARPGHDGFLFGADDLGRDLWGRAVDGLRWSLSCALAADLINLTVGVTLGLAAAQSTGVIRSVIRRVTDVFQSFPMLVIAIIVVVVIGHGFAPLVATLGLVSWPIFMRVSFAEGGGLLQRNYVKAARVAGVGPGRILFSHVLPGLAPTLSSVFVVNFASLLVAESALSFLGIGAPLGVPTWGNMLAASRDYMLTAPWMMLVPALSIIVTVVTANLLATGLVHWRQARTRGDHD
jgi:peptide/nickel transport system permease protein